MRRSSDLPRPNPPDRHVRHVPQQRGKVLREATAVDGRGVDAEAEKLVGEGGGVAGGRGDEDSEQTAPRRGVDGAHHPEVDQAEATVRDRQRVGEGKGGSGRLDLGGRGRLKKKKK